MAKGSASESWKELKAPENDPIVLIVIIAIIAHGVFLFWDPVIKGHQLSVLTAGEYAQLFSKWLVGSAPLKTA